MDSGSDGYFLQKLNGLNKPGVMSYLADQLETGRAYKFKVRALNFNGAGEFSAESTFYSCLPPVNIKPPQFVSSTKTTLKVTWTSPQHLFGCPLQQYRLYRNDGAGSEPETLVQEFQPHVNTYDIVFTEADTSKEFTLLVEARTAGGSVISGTNQLTLANTPGKPL